MAIEAIAAMSTTTTTTRDSLGALDRELVRIARGNGVRRLALGDALDRMMSRGWHHELGFSSLTAYALERIGHTARWVAESRWLARRLASLPLLRAAVVNGTLGWSMAELVARHATPSTERELIAEAARSTVRSMRKRLAPPSASATAYDDDDVEEDEALRYLTMTVDADDAWLLECTQWLFQQLEPNTRPDDFLQALLGEGLSSLFELAPGREVDELCQRSTALYANAAAWRAKRRASREEAETRCESSIDLLAPPLDSPDDGVTARIYASTSATELDAIIRSVAAELTERDLLLGTLADRLWRADGWRQLGFANERQYTRERLGVSLSSVKAKRALARRSNRMPAVVAAIEHHEIGFEAALLVSRIATPETIDAWIERARRRTVKLLREEVGAAELRIRFGAPRDQLPPDEATLRSLASARLTTSRALYQSSASHMSGGKPRDAFAPAGGATFASQARSLLSQLSGTPRRSVPRWQAALGSNRRFGRVTLRFRVSDETRVEWHALEECFEKVRRYLPEHITFIQFLCVGFYIVWGHALDPKAVYAHIFARDGFVCQNPTCARRDLGGHHLKRRSAGGGDEDENLVSLCAWCHLEGVHGGRIKAKPPASHIRWELGREPLIIVEGRDVVAAA